jgi:hypothetical protein
MAALGSSPAPFRHEIKRKSGPTEREEKGLDSRREPAGGREPRVLLSRYRVPPRATSG